MPYLAWNPVRNPPFVDGWRCCIQEMPGFKNFNPADRLLGCRSVAKFPTKRYLFFWLWRRHRVGSFAAATMSGVGAQKPSLSVNRGELRANCLTVVFALKGMGLSTPHYFQCRWHHGYLWDFTPCFHIASSLGLAPLIKSTRRQFRIARAGWRRRGRRDCRGGSAEFHCLGNLLLAEARHLGLGEQILHLQLGQHSGVERIACTDGSTTAVQAAIPSP